VAPKYKIFTDRVKILNSIFNLLCGISQKQPENVEYFTYLGSMITSGAGFTDDIKSRIAMAKAAFN
jgi:hypothetical protein